MGFGFPKPRRTILTAMLIVGVLWVFFAVSINWIQRADSIFLALVGDPRAIVHGQVWRLVTSFLLHTPTGPGAAGHIMTSLLGLYFLGPSIEERWGSRRLAVFMLGTGVFSAVVQVLASLAVARLDQPVFFGSLGVIDAIAVAWALTFRDQQIRLFFVLPVSGRMMLLFIVGMNILYLLALDRRPDGLATPFGGMLAGWLFADGSPLRRRYLEWKLSRIQKQLGVRPAASAEERAARLGLRVVEGGAAKKPDKSMLN